MLTIHDSAPRFGRRDFLRIGSLGLGGLALGDLLRAKSEAAERGRSVTDKSVIFLFLHGGPSQIETFDPKMEAPAEVRSATGEIDTTIPGVTFGGSFPKLSKLAHRMSIVRSYRSGDGNHDIKPIMSRHTLGANLGSLYARVAGTNHPVSGMPTNVALFPRAVDPSTQVANFGFGKFDASGSLGANYVPFVPGGGGNFQKDMELVLKRDHLGDRRNLLTRLDLLKRSYDSRGIVEGMDKFQDQAFQTILGGVSEAFDLSKEDPRTVERYDTAPLVRPDQISRKWNNYNNYVDNAKTLGKLLLLARRLCEAGCGFVTVTTNFVWDMHADVNNATVEEGMQYMGTPLDHALSAFIEDTAERGLSNKIMLVASGEMGRTPRINKNGGRDHWGGLTPLALVGGGLKMGQVIGQSTRDAGEPLSEPLGIDNLISTIMHTLLRPSEVRLQPGIPAEVVRAINPAPPIPGV
ncbi:MAG TPA: DUF1501 domain-containing protein [Pirellulaceae bacterium]|nr:DUF1501 domain-containing protein [Pirellulaceae bacterium]